MLYNIAHTKYITYNIIFYVPKQYKYMFQLSKNVFYHLKMYQFSP